MTIHPIPFHAAPPERAALAALHGLVETHGEALVEAAGLLGGPHEAVRALALLAGLGRVPRPTRSQRAALVRLHRLLALDLDPAHGAGLPSDDPRVRAICALADARGAMPEGLAEPAPAPAPAFEPIPAAPSVALRLRAG